MLDAHPDALGLHEAVGLLEVSDPFFEFGADRVAGGLHAARGHHVLVGGIEVEFVELLTGLHAHRVELADGFERIAPEF